MNGAVKAEKLKDIRFLLWTGLKSAGVGTG